MRFSCPPKLTSIQAVTLAVLCLAPMMAADWRSFGNDAQRTGWSPQETDINRESVQQMGLLWKAHLDNQPRELNSLTAAVAAEWVVTDKGMKEIVVVGGASDNLFALDAANGKLLWKKTFTAESKPRQDPFWLCPNAMNATPLLRKEGLKVSVYAISSDGKLHVLNVTDGEDRMPPLQFVPAYSKNWSLNLAGNTLYTNTSQGCGGAKSGVYAMDLASADHKISFFASSPGGAGIWGRAGVAVSESGWCSPAPETEPTIRARASTPIRCCSSRPKI